MCGRAAPTALRRSGPCRHVEDREISLDGLRSVGPCLRELDHDVSDGTGCQIFMAIGRPLLRPVGLGHLSALCCIAATRPQSVERKALRTPGMTPRRPQSKTPWPDRHLRLPDRSLWQHPPATECRRFRAAIDVDQCGAAAVAEGFLQTRLLEGFDHREESVRCGRRLMPGRGPVCLPPWRRSPDQRQPRSRKGNACLTRRAQWLRYDSC